MKTLHLPLALIIATLLSIVACEEESNVAELADFDLPEAVLIAPTEGFSLLLDRDNRDETLRFEWEAVVPSSDYLVTYSVLIDVLDQDFSDPLLISTPNDNGTQTFVEISYADLDVALANAGFEASEVVSLQWRVEAQSVNESAISSATFSLQRFDVQGPPASLYIAGSATEAGTNLSGALAMNKLTNADGSETNIFQIFTELQSGSTYNFYSAQSAGDATVYTASGENIEIGDTGIVAPETGIYRITVNFTDENVSLLKINTIGIIGNVSDPAWTNDVLLDYQGNGVWRSTIELVDGAPDDNTKRFVIRANEDWGLAFKNTPNSNSEIALEATAGDFGFDGLNDILAPQLGFQEITITLNGEGYSVALATGIDPGDDTGDTALETPSSLYISGTATEVGANIANAQLMKRMPLASGEDTEIFEIYTTLTQGETYNFYSENSDNAIIYTINGGVLEQGDTAITNSEETAVYRVTVDFSSKTLNTQRIDRWSMVGNVIIDGWGGDQALEYQGNGVWQSTVELVDADPGDENKRFVFRANGDWGIVVKEVPDSGGNVALEGTAASFGFETLNDISVTSLGTKVITLNLNGNGYSYSIE